MALPGGYQGGAGLAYNGFEFIAAEFSAGFPFGYRDGNLSEFLTIDNLNTDGVDDFGVVRSGAGYNLHTGVVPFANGTDPATGTSAIRLTPSGPTPFEIVSIKLDTLLTGTGGTVTFTGLKADGVTTVTHTVTLDSVRSLQTFALPDSFNNLIQLDIEGPANFQFDDVDIKVPVIGTSGADLIVLGQGSWFVDGGGGNDDIFWPVGQFGGETSVTGGGGDDYIQIEGGSFNNNDFASGGAGIDELLLRGNHILGAAANMTDIETIHLVTGEATTIGTTSGLGPTTRSFTATGLQYDYTIIAIDGFLPAGEQRTISAASLRFNEELIFDGSAETNGQYILRGGAGRDILIGGALNDQLFGGVNNDTLVGGAGTDTLRGEADNDYLDGGAGADDLMGGAGDDTYVIDSAFDVISELAAEGTDTIVALFNYTLNAANFEVVQAGGNGAINITGDSLVNTIIGNNAANVLDGLADNDILFGRGGSDMLLGGTGNDNLNGESGNDTLNGGAGDDTLNGGADRDTASYAGATAVTVSLAAVGAQDTLGAGLDTLISIENLIGSNFNDTLTGSASRNVLDGGAGADTMAGGDGNEVYVVDNVGDTVVEAAGEGTDLVRSSVTFDLGANVENLTLTGTAAINGIGNDLANTLIGNSAANSLNGRAGADTMSGGSGNDTYIVDNVGDTAVETASAGIDLVRSSVTFTLGANVENLTLTGSGAINGSGNDLANTLVGNSSANTLNGGAGADTINGGGGNDLLIGGTGNDTLNGSTGADNFRFNTALSSSTNVDLISGFSVTDDTIQLDNDIFTAIGAIGTLSAGAFFVGAAAHDASDRIIYDSATGNIYYDADGNGAGAQVLFAQVAAGLSMTNADFQIIG
jgi:Ca2+-binding RTX toxin-like protein